MHRGLPHILQSMEFILKIKIHSYCEPVFALHLAITIIEYGLKMEVVFTSIAGFLGDHFAPRHDRKDSRLSIGPIAQFVVGIAGKVGVVIGGCAVLPRSSC